MPFYIAAADAAGAKITSSEYMLPIAPSTCDYPEEALGILLETSDGAVIQQTPNKDPRRRAWIWENYSDQVVTWPALWDRLQGLRSRTRIEAGAPNGWVFLRDTVSKKLRVRTSTFGTASGGSGTTMTVSATPWTASAYIGFRVTLLTGPGAGDDRPIVSNTNNTITIDAAVPFSASPTGSTTYEIYGWSYNWMRVRVLDTSQSLRKGGGGVRYPESKLVFVVDDPAANDLG